VIFQLQFADFIASRRAARNFSESMLSRGNDRAARSSAISPADRDGEKEANEVERERRKGETRALREGFDGGGSTRARVKRGENEGESKADNSAKLRTGRRPCHVMRPINYALQSATVIH